MPPVRLIERAQADEAVDTSFSLQDPVGVLALRGEGGGLEPGLLAGARLEQLGLKASALRPAEVHAQQHLRPVLGVGPARARVDRDDRVTRVVLAGEECVLLEPVELLAQRRNTRGDLLRHVAVHGEELLGVLVVLCQAAVALEAARQARVLGADLGGSALVVPQARGTELLLQLGDAALQLLRVKGNHGPRRAGPRSPGAPGRAKRSASDLPSPLDGSATGVGG